jgi:hypothetical protein
MARMTDIKTARDLRPCLVKGQKALFHCWEFRSQLTHDGLAHSTLAIVELESGQVVEYLPRDVAFCDGMIAQYAFEGGNA